MSAVKKETSSPLAELEPSGSQPLGDPLPRDEHACSVSLPSWASVVGYEEGDESITSAMRCGYPRFVYHPLILQLMSIVVERYGKADKAEDCLLLPGRAAAVRCQAFLQEALEENGKSSTANKAAKKDNALLCYNKEDPVESSSMSRIRIVAVGAANIHAVLFPAETLAGMQAKAYWQHTGEIVSSRRAEEALNALGVPVRRDVTVGPEAPYIYHPASCDKNRDCAKVRISSDSMANAPEENVFLQMRQRIAQWADVPSKDSVFLTTSGMASIYTALRSARRYQLLQSKDSSSLGGRSIVYGFPYLDTLKLCSRKEFCPGGVEFFGLGDAQDLKHLEQLMERQSPSNKVCALFTEVPSNPLLQCPDLVKLRALADKHDFCLIVDDTIGNFLNIDMINSGLADAVCTSLTKIVSGRGDAMAGSIVVNPNTEKGRWMQQDLARDYSVCEINDTATGLLEADVKGLLVNSQDFPERNDKINETSEILADWLSGHNEVETVWYPKYAPLYPSLLTKPKSGYGGLMSILLDSHVCQRTFYDSLDVAKGPSLGTNFTLVCPYTLLAHYHELDFAMSYNVPPNLLRIAVGLEELDVLKDKFEDAFSKSRLYPKLQQSAQGASDIGSQQRAYSTFAAPMPPPMVRPTHYAAANSTKQRFSHSRNAVSTMQSLLRRISR